MNFSRLRNNGKKHQAGKAATGNTFEALNKSLKGVPLAQSGRMQEALDAFDGAIEIDPTLASSWYNKGYVLVAKGLYSEALAAFDKAIEINPSSIHPWNGRGYALNTEGRFKEALDAFERAVEIDHTQPYPWNGIGNTYTGMGRAQEALDAYNRAIEIDPKFANPWSSKAVLLDTYPELETMAGHTARQSFCRAYYLWETYPQRFPLSAQMLLDAGNRFQLPLLIHQLLQEASITVNDMKHASLFRKTMMECATPLGILSALNSSSSLSSMEKSLWSGIVNHYHGNPVQAFECFDAVDSEDETNITSQYYLILSLENYLEPAEKEKTFALSQAEAVLRDNNMPVDQRYYAGLLFALTGKWEEAAQYFVRNGAHLPSLYMQHLCLSMQGIEDTGRVLTAILEEENRLAGKGRCGYLHRANLPAIDLASTAWIKDLQTQVHFRELETAVCNILEQPDLHTIPAYLKLMQKQIQTPSPDHNRSIPPETKDNAHIQQRKPGRSDLLQP